MGIGGLVYTQSELNKAWRGMPPIGTQQGAIAGGGNADLDRLQKLAALKEAGTLTDQEFDAEKARLGLATQSAVGPTPEKIPGAIVGPDQAGWQPPVPPTKDPDKAEQP